MNYLDELIMQPLGLIAIDLWESGYNVQFGEKHHNWLADLANHLSKINFHSVINSSNHTKIDYTDPSIYNTLVCYNWSNFDLDVMLELISNCNNYVMSKKIIDILDNKAFALYTIDSFNKHRKKLVPHIKNWLVVGCHWQHCTHQRSLGLVNLCKESDLNIYGSSWGFLKTDDSTPTHDDFSNDKVIQWQKIADDLYRASIKNETR